jgi:hypothetical protein
VITCDHAPFLATPGPPNAGAPPRDGQLVLLEGRPWAAQASLAEPAPGNVWYLLTSLTPYGLTIDQATGAIDWPSARAFSASGATESITVFAYNPSLSQEQSTRRFDRWVFSLDVVPLYAMAELSVAQLPPPTRRLQQLRSDGGSVGSSLPGALCRTPRACRRVHCSVAGAHRAHM